jgi:hypothetical protein
MINLFFLILSTILLTSCRSISIRQDINLLPKIYIHAPNDSYIKSYTNIQTLDNHKNYKIFLSDNKGEERIPIETAELKFPLTFNEMLFKLIADEKLILLKTPITLLSINTHKNKAILSLKLHNNIYWLEKDNEIQKISLSLDCLEENFKISQNQYSVLLTVGEEKFSFTKEYLESYVVKISLTRSDLMRYYGLYIPKQTLYVKDLWIK